MRFLREVFVRAIKAVVTVQCLSILQVYIGLLSASLHNSRVGVCCPCPQLSHGQLHIVHSYRSNEKILKVVPPPESGLLTNVLQSTASKLKTTAAVTTKEITER
ncbi:unnamed protein product [Allacma fusca]|uniref:Uncharacterized protein n=1 Tax=Allacma fusca TaxID=39272 RepID=A0A8J2P5C3_9HEXA|nr:unnamed protein product [Allacma fusca]